MPRLVSYNVNGLSFYSKTPSACSRYSRALSTLRDLIPKFDIICLQETRLASAEKFALTSLPNCSISFNNRSMTSAGTLFIDSPSISRYYTAVDIPLPDCCKGYVQLRRYSPKSAPYKQFQIFNIYLPSGLHKVSSQTTIFHSLLSLDPSVPSFFMGDFNFVTSPEDSTGAAGALPPASFLSLFESLKTHFDISEVPHGEHTYFHISSDDPTSAHSYSSRLDRVYVPSILFHSLLSTPTASVLHHSAFRPGLRDHLPIALNFPSDAPRSIKKPLIPLWLASSPEFASNLRAAWRPPPSFKHPFKLLSQFKKTLFRVAATTRKSRLLSSSTPLRLSQHLSLLRALSAPSQDSHSIERLFSFDPSLRSLVSRRQGTWVDAGLEQATRDLLFSSSSPSQHKPHPISSLKDKLPSNRTRISSLRTQPSDPPSYDDRGKAKIAREFWAKVWAAREASPPSECASFLNSYSKEVDPSLLATPLLADVLFSINHSNDSAPGPDGIPYAAWRAAPDLAGPILLAALQAICQGRVPPAGHNYGLLFLIPKKPTDLISDTRPISVTNTDNRILASTIAHSIMPAVSALVHPSQKGFLWGKNGIDHTKDINHFFFEGVVKKRQRLLFLLDTAKAFDSIDHSWAISVLEKAGFPPWVVNFIKASLLEVKVAPCFGNDFSLWIDILRGVKQGCPLSPLIFIIAYDPLLTALSTLPNIKAYAFADDLALTAFSIHDISPALVTISHFSSLSGLGVNKTKSCVISSGPNRSHSKLLQDISSCPWPNLPLRPSATHLGIPIGRDITLAEIFDAPYNKAVARLASARPVISSLSVSSRILFINVFIISLFSYHFLFFILPKEFYSTLKELIRKTVTPFNGGAYSYDSLVSLQLLFSIRPLKDLWAFNVSLLASRSPLISTSTNYHLLPAISLRSSKFIQEHRDASAVDFWRDRHLDDGTLLPLSNSSSTAIYQALITDNFLPLATQHLNNKISSFIFKNSPLSPPLTNCIEPISASLVSSLPTSFLFHHFSLINNALATSRRMRHQNHLPLASVPTCFFCGTSQDSISHLLTSCNVIHSARRLLLSSLGLLPQFTSLFPPHASPSFFLPLSFSFLIDTPRAFIIPLLAFNLAVWKFRCPALGSRNEQDDSWRVARTVELASTLLLRVKKRSPRKPKSDDSAISHSDLLSTSCPNTIVCYTDGSASPNPGPSGAGASIFSPNATLIDLGSSLGHGSNNHAELFAIGMVFSELTQYFAHSSDPPPPVLLFTDSLYAIQVISSTKPPLAHASTVLALRTSLAALLRLTSISLHWIRGHSDVGGNERVDRIAKRFANAPAPVTLPLPVLTSLAVPHLLPLQHPPPPPPRQPPPPTEAWLGAHREPC